jgi:hypothetical protein
MGFEPTTPCLQTVWTNGAGWLELGADADRAAWNNLNRPGRVARAWHDITSLVSGERAYWFGRDPPCCRMATFSPSVDIQIFRGGDDALSRLAPRLSRIVARYGRLDLTLGAPQGSLEPVIEMNLRALTEVGLEPARAPKVRQLACA